MTAATPMGLPELLAASRAFACRDAIVATLARLLPAVEVKSLPGRISIDDLDNKDMFRPPSIGVAAVRIRPADGRMSGLRDVPVEIVAYVVTEDGPYGEGGRLVYRDELGLALCDGLLALTELPEVARWGLTDIGMPEGAEARSLISVSTEERATAYHSVTWWQMLYGQGVPFMDMDSPVPAGATARAILPGDPDWTPPPVPTP
ncbi:hypothetical protein [Methylobacterium sp. SyP6R]|uniref:hypothetical protein n=1 Tax=Methylobacterium sp. SyP6R TaxID=2718876 RepID=UPI001F2C2863|nr:hypothetical protein [Methylobacterium sp. SyP6R]MCF4125042.1 hypothetical protein [Methylobacterium sp. SyP6R]